MKEFEGNISIYICNELFKKMFVSMVNLRFLWDRLNCLWKSTQGIQWTYMMDVECTGNRNIHDFCQLLFYNCLTVLCLLTWPDSRVADPVGSPPGSNIIEILLFFGSQSGSDQNRTDLNGPRSGSATLSARQAPSGLYFRMILTL